MHKPGRAVADDPSEGASEAARLSARRQFLGEAAASVAAIGAMVRGAAARPPERKPMFKTRGVVLVPSDITTWDWPEQAKRVGLSTIATHVTPSQVAAFFKTDKGQAFLERCRTLGLEVEHELHALRDLLPRSLFAKNPEMFRMNRGGQRVALAEGRADAGLQVRDGGLPCGAAARWQGPARRRVGGGGG